MKPTAGQNRKDILFEKTTALFAFGVLFLTLLLFALLVRESLPSIRKFGAAFLTGGAPPFRGPVYGPGLLAAGFLLSIMIVPFILSVSREVLATVPRMQKEAVLSLGGP